MTEKNVITIVSCGTMREDLESLRSEGLLDGIKVVFNEVCLKGRPRELERQLKEAIDNASKESDRILVVYGDGCFIDTVNPERDIDRMIGEMGVNYVRVGEHSCIEMMISEADKERLSQGQKVYWLMPAWIENRDKVFHEWDIGKRNETFPKNDTALVLDSRGYFACLMEEDPEKILEFSDWMGLPMDAREIDLERFKGLLLACVNKLKGNTT
jgi:hypothetical protein